MLPSAHTYIHTYIHTCTYIHTYLHTYIHTYIVTCIHTYIHTYVHTYSTSGAKSIWIKSQKSLVPGHQELAKSIFSNRLWQCLKHSKLHRTQNHFCWLLFEYLHVFKKKINCLGFVCSLNISERAYGKETTSYVSNTDLVTAYQVLFKMRFKTF